MCLYIAEKREVAKAISVALGPSESRRETAFLLKTGDAITWASGHLLRLTDPGEHDESFNRWSLETLPMDWPISHAPVASKYSAKQLEAVIWLVKEADEIVNAGDPDPEGQRLNAPTYQDDEIGCWFRVRVSHHCIIGDDCSLFYYGIGALYARIYQPVVAIPFQAISVDLGSCWTPHRPDFM